MATVRVTSNLYDRLFKIMRRNPVLQFAQKAARPEPVRLSNQFSPSALGVGLDQELAPSTRDQRNHLRAVTQHQTFLNMMRFDFDQRS